MMRWIVGRALALLVAGASLAATDWATYRYPDQGFAVDLPRAPVVKIDKDDPPPMTVPVFPPVTYYMVDLGARGAILVSCTEVTDMGGGPVLYPEKLLDSMIYHTAQKSGATVSWRRNIVVDGHSGRDFTARSKDGQMVLKSRVVLVGVRVYQVLGLGSSMTGVPAEYGCTVASLTFDADARPTTPCASRT